MDSLQEQFVDNNSFNLNKKDFPKSFLWGVATSAYQIEGGSEPHLRGQSIWDTFCQNKKNILDGSNGSIACDHFNRLEDDLDLIKSLGVNSYRFSVSWTRVRKNGYGKWNEQGFYFYDKLLEGLKKRGISAHLTLYHWDLPQKLQDNGGWNNRETCDLFVEYAQEICRRYGNKVSTITTHNEPWVASILGHQHGVFAPGIKSSKIAMQVSHHLLLSHGMVVKSLRKMNCPAKLGIVLNQSPIYPASNHPNDIEKAKIDDGLIIRWYMDPLLKGEYPQDVIEHLGKDAPKTEEGDMEIINEKIDFIGINYYTRNFSSHENPWDVSSTGNEVTDMGWEVYPKGLTELLCKLNENYDLPTIYITENGAAFVDNFSNGRINDSSRKDYLQKHIEEVKNCIEKNINVGGYFAWSLMDNFEWSSGYQKRFGIVYVDYKNQSRYLKDSAIWYKNFLNCYD